MSQSVAESVLPRAIVAEGRVTRRQDTVPVVTSQVLDWPGVLVETGRNDVTEVDDLSTGQHYVSLNVDRTPYTFEVKEGHGFRKVTVPPQGIWVLPSADPITLRLTATFSYVRMSVDPMHLGRLLGDSDDNTEPVRLRRVYGVDAPQIAHLMKTLVAEANSGNPGGLAVVESVTTALGHLLVRQSGVAPSTQQQRSGRLSPAARRRALEVIAAGLHSRLTVEKLAREVGLSPAHFARAFRETMGRSPYQYLLSLRVESARRLLERPDATLSDVALRSGFADQAHFTRLFKRTYGITPGALVRQRRH